MAVRWSVLILVMASPGREALRDNPPKRFPCSAGIFPGIPLSHEKHFSWLPHKPIKAIKEPKANPFSNPMDKEAT